MGERREGMPRGVFAAWIGVTLGLVLLQSVVHLTVVLRLHRTGTMVDLDRSNGIPDVVSLLALGAAASGAMVAARCEVGSRRAAISILAGLLASVTIADLAHTGPHPSSNLGWLVIAASISAVLVLVCIAARFGSAGQAMIAAGVIALAASFVVHGLSKLSPERFAQERPDAVNEYQIATKEGLELLGWSLVALALWDEALARRDAIRPSATGRASRARAASRRRVA
jgi:hypothetical protein